VLHYLNFVEDIKNWRRVVGPGHCMRTRKGCSYG